MWFFLTLYLQQVLGHDALEAGLVVPADDADDRRGLHAGAARLVARFGVRRVLAGGMLLAAAGLLLLTGVAPGRHVRRRRCLPGGVLAALGLGFALVPATIAAVQGVPRRQSGLASGPAQHLAPDRRRARPRRASARSRRSARTARAWRRTAHALTDGFDLAFAVGAASLRPARWWPP